MIAGTILAACEQKPARRPHASVDRGRRRHPRRGGFRRILAPPNTGDRWLPHAWPGRQVHRHRDQGIRQDAAALVPRLRALQSPLTIFIDGIDEYFNKHVEDLPINASVTGELSPEVWYFAQLGLVEVAYQMRRINHHLKIFAAIR